MKKKEIKNLDEAINEKEFKTEAERAFDELQKADRPSEKQEEEPSKKKRRKSIREIRKELREEDEKLLEDKESEKTFEENEETPQPIFSDEHIKKTKARRTKLAVASFILLLGIGVMGNWYYENSDLSSSVKPLITSSQTKTLGEAEYVDATTQPQIKTENEYFAQARVDRETARDEALEQLQSVVANSEESDEAKQTAAEAISKISNYITIENKIETLVSAKGVNNCLAVINTDGTKVDVIVDVDELSDTVILQIKEIAIQQLGCSFQDVSIIQSN